MRRSFYERQSLKTIGFLSVIFVLAISYNNCGSPVNFNQEGGPGSAAQSSGSGYLPPSLDNIVKSNKLEKIVVAPQFGEKPYSFSIIKGSGALAAIDDSSVEFTAPDATEVVVIEAKDSRGEIALQNVLVDSDNLSVQSAPIDVGVVVNSIANSTKDIFSQIEGLPGSQYSIVSSSVPGADCLSLNSALSIDSATGVVQYSPPSGFLGECFVRTKLEWPHGPPSEMEFKISTNSLGSSLSADFSNCQSLTSSLEFSRDSIATYFDSNGLLQTAAVDQPRCDFDPVGRVARGLQIEPASTNILIHSQNLTNVAWRNNFAPIRATVTPNAIVSPSGAQDAFRITDDSSTENEWITQVVNVPVDTAQYVFSGYFRAGSASRINFTITFEGGNRPQKVIVVDWNAAGVPTIQGRSFPDASLENIGNGWYRIWMPFSNDGTNNSFGLQIYPAGFTQSGNNLGSVHAWGLQAERGRSVPTSYIPTNLAPVTRSADVAVLPANSWYSDSASTFLVDWSHDEALTSSSEVGPFTLKTLDLQSVLSVGFDPGNRLINSLQLNLGVAQSNQFSGLSNFNNQSTRQKMAIASTKEALGVRYFENGAAVGGANSAILPNEYDQVVLGQNADGTQILSGHIRSFEYFPRRLPDADLLILTSP